MSTQQARQTRNELAPFFGNDSRADLFIKLFLPNLTTAINATDSASLATNFATAYDFMKAQNYDVKEPGTSDTDLHYDFTDFIVKLANFHRTVDKATGGGNALEQFRLTLNEDLAKDNSGSFN